MWRDVVTVRNLRPAAAAAITAEREARHKRGASPHALAFAARVADTARYRDDPYTFPDAGVQSFSASSSSCVLLDTDEAVHN